MRKLSCTLIVIILIAFSNTSRSQVTVQDSIMCYGNVNLGTKMPVSAANLQNGWVKMYYGDGHSDSFHVYQTNGYWFGSAYHQYTSYGTFTVKRVMCTSTWQRMDSITSSLTLPPCRQVHFNIFRDVNSNCTEDPYENILNLYALGGTIQVDSNGVPVATLPAYAHYYLCKGVAAAVYTFTLSGTTAYPLGCPANGVVTVNVPANVAFNYNAQYAMACNSNMDLAVVSNSHYSATTASTSQTFINVSNFACLPASGVLTLRFSPKYVCQSATPAGSTIVGNTITWNLSNLSDLHPQYVFVHYTPLPGLTVGDTAHTDVYITPTAGDLNPTNNEYHEVDSVTTSYDPNEKSVSPGTPIHSGDELTYTIQFENLGTAPAQNIHILDTLFGVLDPSTIKVVSSSHHVNIDQLPGVTTTNSVLVFDFPGINLPDASQPDNNKGFIVFKIKTRTGYANGTTIPNQASIFFDYNPAVQTNRVVSTIGDYLGVQHMSAVPGSIYPNPVTNRLTIQNAGNTYQLVQIVSTTGQTLLTKELSDNTNTVDVSALAPGLYYIVLNGKNGTATQKVEKK